MDVVGWPVVAASLSLVVLVATVVSQATDGRGGVADWVQQGARPP